jgi:predicted transcriptional regulator
MSRKRSPTLTDAELRMMRVLWDRGCGTVGDVEGQLGIEEPLAYKTILTIMRILEAKGYVRHEKQGRAFVYHPVIDRNGARRSALRHVLNRFFDNSPEALMLNLLQDEAVDGQELERLRTLLEANGRRS